MQLLELRETHHPIAIVFCVMNLCEYEYFDTMSLTLSKGPVTPASTKWVRRCRTLRESDLTH